MQPLMPDTKSTNSDRHKTMQCGASVTLQEQCYRRWRDDSVTLSNQIMNNLEHDGRVWPVHRIAEERLGSCVLRDLCSPNCSPYAFLGVFPGSFLHHQFYPELWTIHLIAEIETKVWKNRQMLLFSKKKSVHLQINREMYKSCTFKLRK